MPVSVYDFVIAAETNNLTLLEIYLREGGDINAVYNTELCALYCAAYSGRLEACRYLLERGAKTDLADKRGKTALDIARERGHSAVADFIQDFKFAKENQEWALLDKTILVHTQASLPLDLRLREIFNFESRKLIVTTESLSAHTQSTTPLTDFSELPERVLRKALEKFRQLGGGAEEDFVFKGRENIKAPLLQK